LCCIHHRAPDFVASATRDGVSSLTIGLSPHHTSFAALFPAIPAAVS
jgi:hypothetical protein